MAPLCWGRCWNARPTPRVPDGCVTQRPQPHHAPAASCSGGGSQLPAPPPLKAVGGSCARCTWNQTRSWYWLLAPTGVLTCAPTAGISSWKSWRCFALGFASPGSRAAARACCAPCDCHTLLSNRTIFSPLCLKPHVIIYLKHAQALALRHVSGNGKSRARVCLPEPCPAFVRLCRGGAWSLSLFAHG